MKTFVFNPVFTTQALSLMAASTRFQLKNVGFIHRGSSMEEVKVVQKVQSASYWHQNLRGLNLNRVKTVKIKDSLTFGNSITDYSLKDIRFCLGDINFPDFTDRNWNLTFEKSRKVTWKLKTQFYSGRFIVSGTFSLDVLLSAKGNGIFLIHWNVLFRVCLRRRVQWWEK